MRVLGTQECPNCGAQNHTSATVCYECGEHLRQRPRNIRCRQCGQRASSNLTICPSCGRELHAAPSRLWTWIVPTGIGLLVLLFLLSRLEGGPMTWVADQVDRGTAWVASMGQEMAPEVTLEMTPIVDAPIGPTEPLAEEITQPITDTLDAVGQAASMASDDSAEVALQPIDTPLPAPTETPTEEPTEQPSSTPTEIPTDVPTDIPTDAPTEAPTATVTNPPTEAATPTPVKRATATLAPTEFESIEESTVLPPTSTTEATEEPAEAVLILVPTNTPAPSPTTSPRTYDIRPGDTLSSIASRFGVTVTALMAANDIATGDVYTLRVGTALVLPGSIGLGGPATQTYTVRAGDTFLNIAGRFGLSAEALRIANEFTVDEVRLLRPGQELVIPADDGPSAPVPSATPTAAASTAPPTSTPVPIPTESALRLDAPMLRSPENNTVVSCQSNEQLAWSGVNFIRPTDEYVLHLGFVSAVDAAGNENITWVLRQARPPSRTAWDMDNDLCGLAPQAYGRQWRWYVDIVDAENETVSRPSETWGFSWN